MDAATMNRAGQIVLVLAALALATSLASWADRPVSSKADDDSLSARARAIARAANEMHEDDLKRGLVIVAASSLLLAASGWAGSAPTLRKVATSLVVLATAYLAFQWFVMTPVKSADPDVKLSTAETWTVGLWALIALLAGSAFLAWHATVVDGFSLGAIVLALAIEVVLFVGWVESPQVESGNYFYTASCLPVLLIGTTLLVNRLQQPS